MKRNRFFYGLLTAAIIILGLASRRKSIQIWLPEFISEYAGDTLYAAMSYFGLAFLFPKFPALKIAVTALIFCFAIESSQLYHAPWIDAIRQTRVGGLVLGFGFLWSDLLCYFVGVTISFLIETILIWRTESSPVFQKE